MMGKTTHCPLVEANGHGTPYTTNVRAQCPPLSTRAARTTGNWGWTNNRGRSKALGHAHETVVGDRAGGSAFDPHSVVRTLLLGHIVSSACRPIDSSPTCRRLRLRTPWTSGRCSFGMPCGSLGRSANRTQRATGALRDHQIDALAGERDEESECVALDEGDQVASFHAVLASVVGDLAAGRGAEAHWPSGPDPSGSARAQVAQGRACSAPCARFSWGVLGGPPVDRRRGRWGPGTERRRSVPSLTDGGRAGAFEWSPSCIRLQTGGRPARQSDWSIIRGPRLLRCR